MCTPKTVPALPGLFVTVTGRLNHLCPFNPTDRDSGFVTITWETESETFEAHDLAAYLRGFAEVETSHEDLTLCIHSELSKADGLTVTTVTTHDWQTAGLTIHCSTSQTQAGKP